MLKLAVCDTYKLCCVQCVLFYVEQCGQFQCGVWTSVQLCMVESIGDGVIGRSGRSLAWIISMETSYTNHISRVA